MEVLDNSIRVRICEGCIRDIPVGVMGVSGMSQYKINSSTLFFKPFFPDKSSFDLIDLLSFYFFFVIDFFFVIGFFFEAFTMAFASATLFAWAREIGVFL